MIILYVVPISLWPMLGKEIVTVSNKKKGEIFSICMIKASSLYIYMQLELYIFSDFAVPNQIIIKNLNSHKKKYRPPVRPFGTLVIFICELISINIYKNAKN